jgi:hypothetical protein
VAFQETERLNWIRPIPPLVSAASRARRNLYFLIDLLLACPLFRSPATRRVIRSLGRPNAWPEESKNETKEAASPRIGFVPRFRICVLGCGNWLRSAELASFRRFCGNAGAGRQIGFVLPRRTHCAFNPLRPQLASFRIFPIRRCRAGLGGPVLHVIREIDIWNPTRRTRTRAFEVRALNGRKTPWNLPQISH